MNIEKLQNMIKKEKHIFSIVYLPIRIEWMTYIRKYNEVPSCTILSVSLNGDLLLGKFPFKLRP